jgi:protoporphyrinogen oxidase
MEPYCIRENKSVTQINKDINLQVLIKINTMAVPFDEIIATLPLEEQEAIERRTRELLAEYKALQYSRKVTDLTPENLTLTSPPILYDLGSNHL